MQIVIYGNGTCRCLYGEEIDLRQLGALDIRRASHVEPDSEGTWLVDLAPMQGPVLGPFPGRSIALVAEVEWLQRAGF
jgi:hypothetical protein